MAADDARAKHSTGCVQLEQYLKWRSRSLPYDKSCCSNLSFRIKSNDSHFCIGKLSLASFDFTDNLVRIGASEHWQLVQRPVPIVVVSWPHCCVQVNFPIFGEFQGPC